MKTIRKNFLLLVFAAGALFLIGNNVLADPTVPIHAPPGDGGITCAGPNRNWGDCLFCKSTYVNHPYFGPSICYSCEFSGWMADYCPEHCSEGCMTL
ncbi:MAG: hypothetical protein RBS53_08490 [Bacteroidales bacterium]|jgi:hypothetical protein|nr:hypothetical protein [Bacteroidales bacterium]